MTTTFGWVRSPEGRIVPTSEGVGTGAATGVAGTGLGEADAVGGTEVGEVLVGFMPRARGTISVMWLSGPKTRMGTPRDSPDEKGSEFWGYY